jgi:hypothetical protein
MANSGNNPYDDLFEDPFGIINRITGKTGHREGFIQAHAAFDRGPSRGEGCPRCGRVGSSCKASYCVYG